MIGQQDSSEIVAYNHDAAFVGAVFVRKGELSRRAHLNALVDRLAVLLNLSEDQEGLAERVADEFLFPLGLQVNSDAGPSDWVEAIAATGALNLQTAVSRENVKVEKDDPEARAHLESER